MHVELGVNLHTGFSAVCQLLLIPNLIKRHRVCPSNYYTKSAVTD